MNDFACAMCWRFATSEAALAANNFWSLGLPAPSLAPYMTGQIEAGDGHGAQRIHGWQSVELFWDVLGLERINALEAVTDSAAGGLLYVTFYYRGIWLDGSGYPWRPLQPEMIGPLHSLRGQYGERNYRLYLNNVTILNNPSLYTII